MARLSITTRHASEPHALGDHGRRRREVGGQAAPALGQGTRVEVRDLFYATPARLSIVIQFMQMMQLMVTCL